ncbi:hypothetical protein E3E11_00225 [Oecophyllibacter saccharovorans]|uniref:translocation/assembly module TamB domain-containing protein n=1 Tax=Oecophyllibacter saccharovorans TaxID=2558360 RepID=UPI0011432B6E|nr:translocation/assembly module TamB domain-containing protein [Oecophyllibacter saccharovorans]QDH14547.1 hypothetical protein E3E11_00225 [Oecophyllibacter saccharovorans]
MTPPQEPHRADASFQGEEAKHARSKHAWPGWGHRLVRIAAWGIAGLLGLLLLAVTTLLVGLNLPQGRALLVEKLPALTGGMVHLSGLSGRLPWHIRIRKLTLEDEKGVWMELDQGDLRWSPLALLHLQVKVQSLTGSRFVFARLPVTHPDPTPKKPSGPLHLPLSVKLDRLAVPQVDLGAGLVGLGMHFSLSGATRIATIQPFLSGFSFYRLPTMKVGLQAHRLDDPTDLELNISHEKRNRRFDGFLHYSEGKQGFVTLLGHLPALDPLRLSLTVSGPLTGLHTTLALQAGARHAKAAMTPGPDSPAGAVHAQQAILQAKLKGVFDVPGARGQMALQVNSAPMTLTPAIGWEGLQLAANLRGPFRDPWGKASLDLTDLAAAGAGARHIMLQFTGQENLQQPDRSLLQLAGSAEGLRLPGKAGLLLAAEPLTLDAEYRPLARTAPFVANLDHALVQLRLKGQLAPAPVIHLALTLPDLQPLGQLAGVALRGQDQLVADIRLPASATSAATLADRVSVKATDYVAITGGDPRAVGMIGPKGKLTLVLTRNREGVLTVPQLALSGAALNVQGHALYAPRPRGQGVKGALTVELPSFEKAVPALRGGGKLTLTAEGPVDDLAARLAFTGLFGVHTATSNAQPGPFALTADVQHLPRVPTGTMVLTGTLDQAPMALNLSFARNARGDMSLDLSRLHWKTLEGAGTVGLKNGQKIPHGNLDIRISQLAAFQPLVGQPLSGHLSLALHTLAEGSGSVAPSGAGAAKVGPHNRGNAQETLVFSLEGAGGLPRYGVRQLQLSGKLHHLPGNPAAEVTLVADGLRADTVTGQLQARVSGPLQALVFRTEGHFQHVLEAPADISLAALLDLPDHKVRIDTLELQAKREKVHLLGPSTVSYGASLGADRLRLAVTPPHGPTATLTASGTVKPALKLDFDLAQLTPALATPFLPKLRARGVIAAHGALGATLADPTGRIVLQGSGLQVLSDATAALAPASLQLQAAFQHQRAALSGQLQAGRDIDLALSGSVPLKAAEALSVAAKGHFNLRAANAVLGVSGMGTSGMLSLDLGVGGTRLHPVLTGGAQLRNGTFDQYTQGVHLTGITGDVVAHDDELEIRDFLIHAGSGTMDLKGSVGVLKPGIPVALAFVANKAQPVHSDVVTATLDARIRIAGQATTRLDVDGNINIPKASITIPDAMPASVPQIQIVNPNAPQSVPASPPLVIGLNLTITAPGQIFVHGHGIFAVMGGKLHIGGTAADPVISGGFDLRNGSFNLAGINLNFTYGRVTFGGAGLGHRLDPLINFRAERNANGILASLIVSGYASDPKLKFVSNPPYPKDDVLSMLLFGSLRASLSPAQLAQLGAAVLELGGGISIDPLNAVRKFLGLDQLTIGGGTGVNKGGVALEAGKYILPGVFVGAREGLGGSGTQAEVKVDLTKHLTLQTTVGTGGQVNGFTTPENDPGSSVSLSYGLNY